MLNDFSLTVKTLVVNKFMKSLLVNVRILGSTEQWHKKLKRLIKCQKSQEVHRRIKTTFALKTEAV